MIWLLLSLAAIALLAWFMKKAGKGTPFEHAMGCTPHIDHLKHLEDESPEYKKHKRENLW